MRRWVSSLKARFWDNTPVVVDSGPGYVSVAGGSKRPLRRLAEWCVIQIKDHAPAWLGAISAVVAAVATVVALSRQ